MPEFAVSIEGVGPSDRAMWVLALDIEGERIMVVHPDKTLHWHPIVDCRFAGIVDPSKPRPFTIVQPSGQPTIYRPSDSIDLGGEPV